MSTLKKILSLRTPKPKYKVLSPIQKRFSPRVFSSDQIPEETMNILFEAARLAPSARNYQPWHFYWMRNGSQAFNQLIACMSELNHWAKSANVLIVAAFDPVDRDSKDGKNKWVLYDLGQSVLSLILQAQELGIYARQIGIFDTEKAHKMLNIPAKYHAFVTIALGKIGREEDYHTADQQYVQKDLTSADKRKTISEKKG